MRSSAAPFGGERLRVAAQKRPVVKASTVSSTPAHPGQVYSMIGEHAAQAKEMTFPNKIWLTETSMNSTAAPLRLDEVSRLLFHWEDRLSPNRYDSNESPETTEAAALTRTETAAAGGLAMLSLHTQLSLPHMFPDASVVGSSGSKKDEANCKDCVELYSHRAGELLVEAMLLVTESCVCAAPSDGLVALASDVLQSPERNASHRHALCTSLLRWWDLASVAERTWRWCDAHVTLCSSDEAALCSGDAADWWWRPCATSGAVSDAATSIAASLHQRLGSIATEIETEVESMALHSESHCHVEKTRAHVLAQGKLKSPCACVAAAECLLEGLRAADGHFGHRIAIRHATLRRLFDASAAALRQLGRLLLNAALFVWDTDAHGVVHQHVGRRLPWTGAPQVGIAQAHVCLITAQSIAQTAVGQFGARATPITPTALHPHVELSNNTWRVVHGIGLLATGHIDAGDVILREPPLLRAQEGTTAEAEAIAKALAALRETIPKALAAQALQIGAIIGDSRQVPGEWATLQLLALMPPATEGGDEKNGKEEGLESALSAIRRVWNERSVTMEPTEDFRIGQRRRRRRSAVDRALYPIASYINHACQPNALRIFNTEYDVGHQGKDDGDDDDDGEKENAEGKDPTLDSLHVVALRDIEAGEEITVSYLPSLLIPQSMKERYNGFRCRCTFCVAQHGALLEGVICPSCNQLLYDSSEEKQRQANKKKNSSAGSSTTPSVSDWVRETPDINPSGPAMQGHRMYAPYGHAENCVFVDSHTGDMVTRCTNTFSEALQQVHHSLLTEEYKKNTNEAQETNRTIEEGTSDEYARRAQCAVRQLMNADAFSRGLPSTHHLRLQVRMECLAVALNAVITPHDSARLLELGKALLEDLELLLPPSDPLLTGVRLHLCFARGRHWVATDDVDDAASGGAGGGICCGAVRTEAETVRLPFVRDAAIREGVAQAFQEHCVRAIWRFQDTDNPAILQDFLQQYAAELLPCGITEPKHMAMLSLLLDAATESVFPASM